MSTATAAAPAPQKSSDPWLMSVPAPGGNGEYVLCPAGNHPGTVVGIYDLGTHVDKAKDGSDREVHKLALVFELMKKKPDGKPFLIGERYTWSMSEKANFYAVARAITGHKFREGEQFDPRSLLGQHVMIGIAHTTSGTATGGEKTYHNISAVAGFPEDLPAPQPTRKPIAWSVLSGEPWPSDGDLPYIYGKSIAVLAQMSKEGKARSDRPAPAAGAEGNSEVPF